MNTQVVSVFFVLLHVTIIYFNIFNTSSNFSCFKQRMILNQVKMSMGIYSLPQQSPVISLCLSLLREYSDFFFAQWNELKIKYQLGIPQERQLSVSFHNKY